MLRLSFRINSQSKLRGDESKRSLSNTISTADAINTDSRLEVVNATACETLHDIDILLQNCTNVIASVYSYSERRKRFLHHTRKEKRRSSISSSLLKAGGGGKNGHHGHHQGRVKSPGASPKDKVKNRTTRQISPLNQRKKK